MRQSRDREGAREREREREKERDRDRESKRERERERKYRETRSKLLRDGVVGGGREEGMLTKRACGYHGGGKRARERERDRETERARERERDRQNAFFLATKSTTQSGHTSHSKACIVYKKYLFDFS